MPVYKLDALPNEMLTPKYSAGAGSTVGGEQIEVGRVTFPAGTGAIQHAHPNEQICFVLAGRARLRIGDEGEADVRPGDAWLVPSGVLHSITVTEALTMITCKNLVGGMGHRIP